MVDIANSIPIMNTNVSIMKLLVKNFLFTNSISNSSISCLSFKSKFSFSCLYWAIYSLSINGVESNVSSNVLLLRKMGSANSEVDL